MVIVIDNYDSFTYNLVQYLSKLGQVVRVYHNDRLSVEAIQDLKPSHIVISPGPGSPCDAGISLAVIRRWGPEIPILGVCLGHQSIGQAYGGRIVSAQELMHGKLSRIFHNGVGAFRGIPNCFQATRYHSLALERSSLPECLEVTAWTDDGEIMGLRHKHFSVQGVQFHPEAILTEHGHQLLENFLSSS
jgi:anthranilate synthase component 2